MVRSGNAKIQQLDIVSAGFSSKGWLLQCNSSLVCASAGIDDLCSAIVATKSLFNSDLSSPISRELGDLALTVATLERSLYDYARRIRVAHRRVSLSSSSSIQNSPAVMLSPDPSSNEPSALTLVATESEEVGTSSVGAVDGDKFLWKHPGAVFSLLDLLTDSMEQLGSVLHEMKDSSTFFNFLQKHKAKLVAVVALVAVVNTYLKRASFLKIFRASLKGFSITPIICKLASVIAGLVYFYHWSLNRSFKRLQTLHSRLSTILRFWHLCMSEVSNAADSSSSHAGSPRESKDHSVHISGATATETVKAPSKAKKKGSMSIPIGRWMLDLVGVGTIWYDCMYDVDKDLWFLWYTYSILYSSVSNWYYVCGNAIRWYGFPVAVMSAMYYSLRPRLAAATAAELLSSIYSSRRMNSMGSSFSKSRRLRLSHIRNAWIFYDNLIGEWKRKWSWLWGSFFKNNELTHATAKVSFWPLRWMAFYCVSVMGLGPGGVRLKPPVGVVDADAFTQMMSVVGTKQWQKARSERSRDSDNPILFYIHGGGWVANFLNSDLTFLNDWAEACDIPVVVFDYSLSRRKKFSYDDALKQVAIAYDWVSTGGLGFDPSRILLAGDSVGARISIALCTQLIMSNVEKIPSSLVLAYPPMNVSQVSSPSRAVFMMDPIVPMSILNQTGDRDNGQDYKGSFDYYINAPDNVMMKFPPTSIMVGGIDPFVDDSVEFAHRLSSLGVFCRLKVYKNLPHGFLGFQTMLPKARKGVSLAADWLKESLETKSV
jgi:acetyl esterase/lipase